MISSDFLDLCITVYRGSPNSPATTAPPVSDPYSEAHSDFYGFPSNPVSIYHTGDPWPRPTGPEAQRVPKEARPICKYPIVDVWHELGRQIYKYFDSIGIKWTSIDPVRFAELGKEAGPLFLWVGVMPGTLSRDDAEIAAAGCKQILLQSQITDVEIAFRESVFARSVGPQLLNYVPSTDPTAYVQSSFTPALGLRIASKSTPFLEGTGGLYICEGGESNRVFVLTARHVVFPENAYRNNLYTCKNNCQPRHEVILLGSKAYQDVLGSVMGNIGRQAVMVNLCKDELERLEEVLEDDWAANFEDWELFGGAVEEAEKSIETLNEFHTKITRSWALENERILGHVAHAPPISIGTGDKCYMEDWALVVLHREKIDWTDFRGNVLDLGRRTEISPADFALKMYPHADARTSFEYPLGGLLQLQDVVKEDELHHATTLDVNGEECFIVVKNGNTTGVTIGRGTSTESFVREYDDYGVGSTSMQVAIYPYSHEDGAFSAPGDSGSIVVDGKGRIMGILTGGAGKTDSIDVTYLLPYYWVEERIKAVFPNAHLYPIMA
ncbi:hypothetical protein F5141DRAFT_591568 [Pisolithus sp. B1]|nr:hypothetical protein F5141DRAFT_591568 [Pisolithus sp. B1]